MKEEEIIEKLLQDDEEFKRIYFEHRELDDKVKRLQDKDSLSLSEQTEIKNLKKMKLSLKDQMERKISELR